MKQHQVSQHQQLPPMGMPGLGRQMPMQQGLHGPPLSSIVAANLDAAFRDEAPTVLSLLLARQCKPPDGPTGPTGGLAALLSSAKRAPNGNKIPDGVDPRRLRVAKAVGAARLRAIQEAVQQQYILAYAQLMQEQQAQIQAQMVHEKEQEAAQLALIMQAAEAQAEIARTTLEQDKEEHHWHRRIGRHAPVCGHWQQGKCVRGESCQFAHPEKEKGTAQTRAMGETMMHNFKTMICKYYTNGTCSKQGHRCMFAHGPEELRVPGTPLSSEAKEMIQKVIAARMAAGADKEDKEPQVVLPTPQQRALIEAASQLQQFAATAATAQEPAVGQLAAIASAQSVALGMHAPQAAQLMAMASLAQQLGGAAASMPVGSPAMGGGANLQAMLGALGGKNGPGVDPSALTSLLSGLSGGGAQDLLQALTQGGDSHDDKRQRLG